MNAENALLGNKKFEQQKQLSAALKLQLQEAESYRLMKEKNDLEFDKFLIENDKAEIKKEKFKKEIDTVFRKNEMMQFLEYSKDSKRQIEKEKLELDNEINKMRLESDYEKYYAKRELRDKKKDIAMVSLHLRLLLIFYYNKLIVFTFYIWFGKKVKL